MAVGGGRRPELTADGGRGPPHEAPARRELTQQPVRRHVQPDHRRLVEVPHTPVRAGAEAHRGAVSGYRPLVDRWPGAAGWSGDPSAEQAGECRQLPLLSCRFPPALRTATGEPRHRPRQRPSSRRPDDRPDFRAPDPGGGRQPPPRAEPPPGERQGGMEEDPDGGASRHHTSSARDPVRRLPGGSRAEQ